MAENESNNESIPEEKEETLEKPKSVGGLASRAKKGVSKKTAPKKEAAKDSSSSDEVAEKPATKKKAPAKKATTAKKTTAKAKASEETKDAESTPKAAPKKAGVKRKGPIGAKGKKVAKVKKSEFGMRMCIRCPMPFEPVEEDEVVCPKCKDHVETRFSQLFGDEDPYSPQPTLRTNKIARVIIRKNQKNVPEEEPDIAEQSLEAIDRYDDD